MSEILREAEIRPDDLMAEQARRYLADVERLLGRRDEFVAVGCPACDADRPSPIWRKYELDYVDCGECRTRYMSPRPSPAVLEDYYSNSENYAYWNEVVFPASEDARRAKVMRPRAERITEIAKRAGLEGGTLVDVGAGYGTFLEEAAAIGHFDRVMAIEPEPNLAARCREKGLEVVESPVESAEVPGGCDVVTSFEVIEHLFSPREFIRQCRGLLPEGGLFVVTCPNGHGFDVLELGAESSAVDTEHLNYFHPASLGALLESEAFAVLETQTPGRLDAELVRKAVLDGRADLRDQPFLQRVLIDEWETQGERFQDYLVEARLSSNQWIVAKRD